MLGIMVEGLDILVNILFFYLKELVNVGLVMQEWVSCNFIYCVVYVCMNVLLGYFIENCCQGNVCLVLLFCY